MSDMPGCRVEVAWTTPPRTRPVDGAWSRVDQALDVYGETYAEDYDETVPGSALRSLTTKRGGRVKVAEIEAGDATAVFDNGTRVLDPSNPASPWAPNVKPRRRIRYIIEPADGSADRKLHTGFIERLPTGWEVGDGWLEITSVDLLGLIAGDTLPPSVLHATIVDSAPLAYWPLTETSGSTVDDVIGTADGELTKPLAGTVDVVPFDRRPVIDFKRPDDNDPAGQRVRVRPMRPTGGSFTLAAWVRQTGDVINSTLFLFQPAAPVSASHGISIGMSDPGMLYAVANDGGSGFDQVDSDELSNVYDEQPHRVVVTINAATGAVGFWWDGQAVGVASTSLDPDFGDVNLTTLAATLETLELGWGTNFGGSSINAAGAVGHAVYWDRVLTAQEIADDYAAGVNPWAGDRTDERLERILDLAGIDPGDRDIEQGTATCEPATLDGGNLVEYLRRVVATEPGSTLFVNPDGQITFRPGVANDPTPLATFVGDPDVDAGTPYTDVTPDYSLDRVVNIAEVTRSSGVTQRMTNDDSVEEFGPLAVEFDTLHRTASGARGAAARLTFRYPEPRLVFPTLELSGRRDDVPPTVSLDLEVNDPADVVARPTGGGDPIEQISVLERIEHALDWRDKTWTVQLGLAEHVVLPLFEWDTVGQGWDQSVWPAT